jgi:hypothetical protein
MSTQKQFITTIKQTTKTMTPNSNNQIRDDPAMMELFIRSQNETRATSNSRRKGWFRNNRFMLLFIVFWLSIIAIAVAL